LNWGDSVKKQIIIVFSFILIYCIFCNNQSRLALALFDSRRLENAYLPTPEEEIVFNEIKQKWKEENLPAIDYLGLKLWNTGDISSISRARYLVNRQIDYLGKFKNFNAKLNWAKLLASHPNSTATDNLFLVDLINNDDGDAREVYHYQIASNFAEDGLKKKATPYERFELLALLSLSNLKAYNWRAAEEAADKLHKYIDYLPPMSSNPEKVDRAWYSVISISNAAYSYENKDLFKKIGFSEYKILSWQMKNNTTNPTHPYRRGKWFFHEKKYKEALSDLTSALKINAVYEDALDLRIKIYEKMNSPLSAIQDCTTIINNRKNLILDPEYKKDIEYNTRMLGYNYASRGFLYIKANKCQNALQDFAKACELGVNVCNVTCLTR